MTRCLISFDEGAMTFPEEDLPAVAEAAHEVMRQAVDAGVRVFGGGLLDSAEASVVAVDGTVTERPLLPRMPALGGFCVVDVPSRAAALEWAARTAVACRCAQQVREFMDDAAS